MALKCHAIFETGLKFQPRLKFAMQSNPQTPFFFQMKATPKFVTHTAKLNAGYPTDFHGIRIVFLNPDELTVVKQEKVIYYFTKVPLLPPPLCVYLHVLYLPIILVCFVSPDICPTNNSSYTKRNPINLNRVDQ